MSQKGKPDSAKDSSQPMAWRRHSVKDARSTKTVPTGKSFRLLARTQAKIAKTSNFPEKLPVCLSAADSTGRLTKKSLVRSPRTSALRSSAQSQGSPSKVLNKMFSKVFSNVSSEAPRKVSRKVARNISSKVFSNGLARFLESFPIFFFQDNLERPEDLQQTSS